MLKGIYSFKQLDLDIAQAYIATLSSTTMMTVYELKSHKKIFMSTMK